MNYNFEEHKHRFAVWTAARAVQRGFVSTKVISQAIDKTSLRKIAFHKRKWKQESFDETHAELCRSLMSSLTLKKTTFGRAAKIVAVYLKTVIVIAGKPSDTIMNIIHPPIDGILLKNLSGEKGLSHLKKLKWTSLNEEEYNKLMRQIRDSGKRFNWQLERFWKPELS